MEGVKIDNKRRYQNGSKYCSKCGVFYLTDENRCPVCRSLLREHPRAGKYRNTPKKYVKVSEEIFEEGGV